MTPNPNERTIDNAVLMVTAHRFLSAPVPAGSR